jgi:hypothetical protein
LIQYLPQQAEVAGAQIALHSARISSSVTAATSTARRPRFSITINEALQ